MSIDVAIADKLLTTTRGVRKRMDFSRPVDPAIITECIEVAMQAPVGSQTWGVHFVVVTEPELKMKVADLYRKSCYPYLDDLEAADRDQEGESEADPRNRGFAVYRWQADTLHELPVLVIVAIEGRFEDRPVIEQASMYGNVLPVAWSFMLALRARGLGSCWTTLHLAYERETAEALGMPDDVTQAVLLPVGYYTGEDFRPATRPPADRFIHWNGWGE